MIQRIKRIREKGLKFLAKEIEKNDKPKKVSFLRGLWDLWTLRKGIKRARKISRRKIY